LEGTFSPTSHVLPKWSLFGEYQYVLGKGWVAHLGLRHAEFPDTGTYMGALTMEKYWGDYRAAIVLSPSVVEGAGLTASYRVVLDRYYGDGSRIGLGYTIGRELEKIGQDSVLATDVSAFNLLGRHRFPGQWAATYELSIHQQGDFYTRRGVRFGLRYIF
jgi:YaiO family outer membrane protein